MSNENEKIFKRQGKLGTKSDCKTDSECQSQMCQAGSLICVDIDFRPLGTQCIVDLACKNQICNTNSKTCTESDSRPLGSSCLVDNACNLGVGDINGCINGKCTCDSNHLSACPTPATTP
ncbi:hypothetical protein F8M41_004953 [Gigaspora margarita]|uniref:Uncharacterized protein n=1 Tax=Gigaspora margarita TaxID=4874 RepID=A0A8H4ERY5_GIGMA|nr:hypothetical protein F8M41_004953 [Gigaspora margarita]